MTTLATPSKQLTMEPSVYWMNIVVLASEKRLTPSKDANAKKRKKRGVVVVWCASTSSSPVVESLLHTYTYGKHLCVSKEWRDREHNQQQPQQQLPKKKRAVCDSECTVKREKRVFQIQQHQPQQNTPFYIAFNVGLINAFISSRTDGDTDTQTQTLCIYTIYLLCPHKSALYVCPHYMGPPLLIPILARRPPLAVKNQQLVVVGCVVVGV